MSLHELYLTLLIGGLVLLASIVGTRLATRVGFPSLLLFLLVGVVIGEDGLGLQFDDVELARNVCTAGLAVILVEGGLTTNFTDIRKVLAPAGALATIGVVISAAVTAVGAHVLLRIDWQLAFLLGAIVSPPTPPRCSPCCACCRCRAGWPDCSKPSRASTTPLR
jgi:cell volume regulation protein A